MGIFYFLYGCVLIFSQIFIWTKYENIIQVKYYKKSLQKSDKDLYKWMMLHITTVFLSLFFTIMVFILENFNNAVWIWSISILEIILSFNIIYYYINNDFKIYNELLDKEKNIN